jgi:hypothetical protein
MLHTKSLVKLESFRNHVGIEFEETLIEKRCEILGKLVWLLETRSEPVSKCSDVGDVMVVTQLWLVLNALFKIALIIDDPPEHSLLDLLVVFLFEEVICEKLHWSNDQEFSSLWADIEGSDWSICWKTDWTSRKKCITWLSYIECWSIWIDKFETSIFISVRQVIFSISIFFGILSWFIFIILYFVSSIGSSILIQNAMVRKDIFIEFTYLTNSSFRQPLPIKASFGCKYLWNVFLITESLFTLMPTYSSIALMLVFYFSSPPSAIIIIHRPPSSM